MALSGVEVAKHDNKESCWVVIHVTNTNRHHSRHKLIATNRAKHTM